MDERRKKYNKILKKYFGHSCLKNEQFKIIDRTVHRKGDTLAILATGFGKSICFQLPFLITKKCVIVVSPLIALMNDQKIKLEKLKIPVCCMNSFNEDKRNDWNRLLMGDYKIVYITPEYIISCKSVIKKLVNQDGICCFAIDESHCISSWSDISFRPEYKELNVLRELAPSIPIMALTATASPKVQKDIIRCLRLVRYKNIQSGFDRPNLKLIIESKSTEKNLAFELRPILKGHENESIIVYTRTRRAADKLALKITSWGMPALAYHANMNRDDRTNVQQKFTDGEINCIVATIAFGMGIDNPQIRLIVHYGCPSDIESYYQEIGRAGRDGMPSICVLMHSPQDFGLSRYHLQEIEDPEYKKYKAEQINNMEAYVHTHACSRKLLLEHFCEEYPKNNCNNCDVCCRKTKMIDVTAEAVIMLSLIKELHPATFGSTTLVGILRGSNAKNITMAMKKLTSYNVGKKHDEKWWKSLIKKLVAKDLLEEEYFDGKFGGSIIRQSVQGLDWYAEVSKSISTNKVTGFERILI
ncbi:MAG: hypothetical protein A3F91_08400 [Flavobacteria bacterium RIFCSPLOWO2_12_FULL_35_11]|nr:MAG: hypothetical protein A3F91_08400 [Flavobacteria bacterium RIFCSPLOWO2_12_FULL_35_11]